MTLVQDIPTFDGKDSSKLEDWLMDIETGTDIFTENHTHLAETKSCGITCTLICVPFKQANAGMNSRASLHGSSVM